MNRLMIVAGAGAAVVVLAGCGPELAQVPYGSEEARWQKVLRENYSGYEAPRTAPPAIRDNVSPRLIEEEEQKRKSEQAASVNPPPPAENPPAAEDPALMVDKAAAQEQPPAAEAKPAEAKPAEKQPAAKPAKKPAEKKPAAKPADKEKAAKAADKGGESEYVVKPHDTLGGLAQKFYGDARRSDVIIRANPALKKNPNLLKPGMKLVIPKI